MWLALIAAAAAFHSVDVNAELGPQIQKAGAKSGLTVVVPPKVPWAFKRFHGSVAAAKDSYSIILSPAKDCNGANVCTLGSFAGDATAAPSGSKTVHLHQGLSGKFQPLSCGASCSPPVLSWAQSGVTYSVSMKEHPGKSDRRFLTKLANSAIDAAGGYRR